jgi:hypothetical protein
MPRRLRAWSMTRYILGALLAALAVFVLAAAYPDRMSCDPRAVTPGIPRCAQ